MLFSSVSVKLLKRMTLKAFFSRNLFLNRKKTYNAFDGPPISQKRYVLLVQNECLVISLLNTEILFQKFTFSLKSNLKTFETCDINDFKSIP